MTTQTMTFPVPAVASAALNGNPAQIVAKAFAVLVDAQKRYQQAREMQHLEDWQLEDVGLSRANINAALAADAQRPLWDGFAR